MTPWLPDRATDLELTVYLCGALIGFWLAAQYKGRGRRVGVALAVVTVGLFLWRLVGL